MARTIKKEVGERVRAYVSRVERDIPVSAVYVFGSHAKGTETTESDIDVAIVSPAFGRDPLSDGFFLQKKLWESSFKNIDAVGYSPASFSEENSPLIQEIKEHGLLLR